MRHGLLLSTMSGGGDFLDRLQYFGTWDGATSLRRLELTLTFCARCHFCLLVVWILLTAFVALYQSGLRASELHIFGPTSTCMPRRRSTIRAFIFPYTA